MNCTGCDAYEFGECPGVGANALCAEGRRAAVNECASYVAGECLVDDDGVCKALAGHHCACLAKIWKVKP